MAVDLSPLAREASPMAVASDVIAWELSPTAVVPNAVALESRPMAVEWNPVAVEEFPMAVALVPVPVAEIPLACPPGDAVAPLAVPVTILFPMYCARASLLLSSSPRVTTPPPINTRRNS